MARASGLTGADVAAGISAHRATLYRWLAEPDTEVKRALCDRLKKANVGFKRTMLVDIRDASGEGPENWAAAAWLLERKWPQEYARCKRVSSGDGPTPVQLTLGI
jgi:hypothetical protein